MARSTYGGSWSSSEGIHYFESDEEALGYGMAYVDYHNGWEYTEHKSPSATVLAYLNQQYDAEMADMMEKIDPNTLLLASLGGPDGVPIIRSPYPYCESESSWKNIYYWYQYYGNRVDQIFEGDCNDGVPPKFVQFFAGSFITPTSIIVNTSAFVSGLDPFTGQELNDFHRFVRPTISIILSVERYIPVGTDWIWDVGVEIIVPKDPKK